MFILIILSLDNKHIIPFLGYFTDYENIYIVMSYAHLGNLHSYIQQVENGMVSLERARLYLRQVTAALDYLSSARVAHRDIKLENVVLKSKDCLQLCDFGWAISYNEKTTKRSTLCGTPLYVPPEMLGSGRYDPSFVDAWALGILAHEIILDQSPFDLDDIEWDQCSNSSHAPRRRILDKIKRFSVWTPPPLTATHAMAINFIAALLKKDPAQRMTFPDALCHPFLQDQEPMVRSRKVGALDAPRLDCLGRTYETAKPDRDIFSMRLLKRPLSRRLQNKC